MKIMYKDKQVAGGSGGPSQSKITEMINTAITASETKSATTYLKMAGGTMSGVIDMGTNKISNLAAPTENNDAATKKYVDDLITSSINTSITEALGGSY